MKKIKTKKIWHYAKKYNTLFAVMIVLMWMSVLIFANYSNSQSLQRAELSKNIKILEDKMRLLNTEISQLQTTERLELESQKLNLVKIQADDIFYVGPADSRVALR